VYQELLEVLKEKEMDKTLQIASLLEGLMDQVGEGGRGGRKGKERRFSDMKGPANPRFHRVARDVTTT